MKLCLIVLISITLTHLHQQVNGGSVPLNGKNINSLLENSELVMVNFYANWCRFSQMLEPIYDQFADQITKKYPIDKLLVAKVDCDVEKEVAAKFSINKYPTLKLFRYGQPLKREYRGQRSADAFAAYIDQQLQSPIKKVANIFELDQVEPKKRKIIAYFNDELSASYKNFEKVASFLRESCVFVSAIGSESFRRSTDAPTITFRDANGQANTDSTYDGNNEDYTALYNWVNNKCTPLVQEITFENAEELTEVGLPFLILFRKPDDTKSLEIFERQVQRQLIHERSTITVVHADGLKFSHPLQHLGKSVNDLPLIAIDSFRHMYVFPDFKKVEENGDSLKQFVADLHSGKLHREFHNGPDPTTKPVIRIEDNSGGNMAVDIGIDNNINNNNNGQKSTPPESAFVKLGPSKDRYNFKNEL